MDNTDSPTDEQFREKIKSLSFEELIALTALMKRQTADESEEFRVLAEMVFTRRKEQLARRRQN